MTLIVVIGRARSGTNVLRTWIEHNGGFDAGEILHGVLNTRHRFFRYAGERVAADHSYAMPMRMLELLPAFIDHLQEDASGRPLIIDVKYSQIYTLSPSYALRPSLPTLLETLFWLHPNVIHLKRRNVLRALVSEQIAERTGVWGLIRDEDRPTGREGLHLPVETLTNRLAVMEDDIAQVDSFLRIFPKRADVEYEQMFDADGAFSLEVADLASELLAKSVDRTPLHAKMNPEPLYKLLANYPEVERTLAGTKYEWMCGEGDDVVAR